MRYIKITPYDIANGPGVRVVFWVAGCEHHCFNCHNPETWAETAGNLVTEDVVRHLIALINNPHIQGITFSGGDPMATYNRKEVLDIIKLIRKQCPKKDIWIYSGYTFEKLMGEETAKEALGLADVLVDGRFVQDLKEVGLKWKGSKNQRVIDLPATRAAGQITLFK